MMIINNGEATKQLREGLYREECDKERISLVIANGGEF